MQHHPEGKREEKQLTSRRSGKPAERTTRRRRKVDRSTTPEKEERQSSTAARRKSKQHDPKNAASSLLWAGVCCFPLLPFQVLLCSFGWFSFSHTSYGWCCLPVSALWCCLLLFLPFWVVLLPPSPLFQDFCPWYIGFVNVSILFFQMDNEPKRGVGKEVGAKQRERRGRKQHLYGGGGREEAAPPRGSGGRRHRHKRHQHSEGGITSVATFSFPNIVHHSGSECSTRFSLCKKIGSRTMVFSRSWFREKVVFYSR